MSEKTIEKISRGAVVFAILLGIIGLSTMVAMAFKHIIDVPTFVIVMVFITLAILCWLATIVVRDIISYVKEKRQNCP